MNNLINVMLLDSHLLFREMFSSCLSYVPGINVVSTVENAEESVRDVARLMPDVILLDIDMPGMSCFDAIRTIREIAPEIRFILLTSLTNDSIIDQLILDKVEGFLTKNDTFEQVIKAIRTVNAGGQCLSHAKVLYGLLNQDRLRLARLQRTLLSTLTVRELEMLCHLALGRSRKEIAGITNRSIKTIQKHSNNIMTKLNIHDRVALTRFSIREGLIKA